MSNIQQPLVLFDIDYTLFDTQYFHNEFPKAVAKITGVPQANIDLIQKQLVKELVAKENYLDIQLFIQKLATAIERPSQQKQIEDILFKTSFFKRGIYNEVEKTLSLLEKYGRIGIFSQGDPLFQLAKVQQSDLFHFFDTAVTYIKRKKMDFLPELIRGHTGELLYFVDDKPSVLHEIKMMSPGAVTIWIKRGRYMEEAKDIENFAPDFQIQSLEEVIRIVQERN